MVLLSESQIEYLKNPVEYRKEKRENAEYQMRKRIRKNMKKMLLEVSEILKILGEDKFSQKIRTYILDENMLKVILYNFFKYREKVPDMKILKEIECHIQKGINDNKNKDGFYKIEIKPTVFLGQTVAKDWI